MAVLDQGAVPVEEHGAAGLTPASACASARRISGPASSGRVRGSSSTRPRRDPRHDAGVAQPQPERESVGAERTRRRALTSVVGSTAPGNEPPPTADSPGSSARMELGRTVRGQALGAARQLRRVEGQHPQHRNLPHRGLGVVVQRERGLERREGQLVGAQGPRERIAHGSARPASRGPTRHPACGPPSSLSPLKSTRSAPAASASATRGSTSRPQGERSAQEPAPDVVQIGHARLGASAASPAGSGDGDESALLEVASGAP